MLITKGASSIPNLVQWTGLNSKSVKEALIVLIHHNIVQFQTQSEKGKDFVFYNLNMMSLMIRLRFPSIVIGANQRYGIMV